jgi:hypothetical protein
MLVRRCLMLASVSTCVYPRRSYAASHVVSSSYRERFQKLNESDNQLVLENYKNELTKAFGHPHVVSALPTDTIKELHYILVLYSKPLGPERRIMLRKILLPYLESSNEESQKLFKYILKYYDVL